VTKPREFLIREGFIAKSGTRYPPRVTSDLRVPFRSKSSLRNPYPVYIRVIEDSAYKELQAKLTIAIEALEFYAFNSVLDTGDQTIGLAAREALAKIEGEK